MKILLIEDDARTAGALRSGLKEEGYVVDVAGSGEEGEELADVNTYHVIILDWYLPGKDGLTVCRDLRRAGIGAPILMLTARDALADRVAGLDTGVDDYMTKPFAFAELLARLRALLRRGASPRPSVLMFEDLRLDPATHRVRRGDRPVQLTIKEYQILELLMRRPGEVVWRAEVEEAVWAEATEVTSNAVDVHISHLRRKIDRPGEPRLLHTVRGRGYLLGQMDP
jgi:DNA-binding response OmpR family regulator